MRQRLGENREADVITLRGPASGGEIIRIAASAHEDTLNVSQLLPKAMRDEVIFRDFCHSGNVLLLNRKVEQLLTTVSGAGLRRVAVQRLYLAEHRSRAGGAGEPDRRLLSPGDPQGGLALPELCAACSEEALDPGELQTISDYVSAKARLLAEECLALLSKHVTGSRSPASAAAKLRFSPSPAKTIRFRALSCPTVAPRRRASPGSPIS